MESSRLESTLRSIVSPKATEQSLRMGFLRFCKLGDSAVEAFLERLCDMSVYCAARLVQNCPVEIAARYAPFVRVRISCRLRDTDRIDGDTLLSTVSMRDAGLFQTALLKLADDCLGEAYSMADTTDACRLAEYVIRYAPERDRKDSALYFSRTLDSHGPGTDEALKALLEAVLEKGDELTFSALLESLGADRLEVYCGERFREELEFYLILGTDSVPLWYQYIDVLFSRSLKDEEALLCGLWFVQMFAPSMKVVLPYFMLRAYETLGPRNPFLELFDPSECCSKTMPWQYLSSFEAELNRLWSDPDALLCFLELMEPFNPYTKSQKAEYRIIQEVNAAAYQKLIRLFDQGCDCQLIIQIFLNSFLKNQLPMEDLMACFSRYGRLESAMEVFSELPFQGTIQKVNETGNYVIAPREYMVLRYHELSASIQVHEAQMIGATKSISYCISEYKLGRLMITPVSDPERRRPESWSEIISELEKLLEDSESIEDRKNDILELMDFTVECFESEYDFNHLTRLLARYADCFSAVRTVVSEARWNRAFQAKEAHISTHLYTEFQKYRNEALTFFKRLFSAQIPYEELAEFYLHSIYRIIVPFDCFLSFADRSAILPVLRGFDFRCRVRNVGERCLCRLIGILCGPVSVIEGADDVDPNRRIRAICVDYEKTDGVVTSILFRNAESTDSPKKTAGAFFGYIARNADFGIQKEKLIRSLCPAGNLDLEALLFTFARMEDAVHIRRTSGMAIMRLLRAMGDRNPFWVHLDLRISQMYLEHLYSEQRGKRCRNDLVSIVLNTPVLQEIAEIYLNTSIRFYVSEAELRDMISLRRHDLSKQLDALFSESGLTVEELDARFTLWSSAETGITSALPSGVVSEEDEAVVIQLTTAWAETCCDATLMEMQNYTPENFSLAWKAYKTEFNRFLADKWAITSRDAMLRFLIQWLEALTELPRVTQEKVIALVRRISNSYSYHYHSNLFTDAAHGILLKAYGLYEADAFLASMQNKKNYMRNS